jgi:hypothetical protein
MRNISDKSSEENQNTYFMVSNFFLKIVPFMTQCGGEGGGRARQTTDDNMIQQRKDISSMPGN